MHDPLTREVVRQGAPSWLLARRNGNGDRLVALRRTLAGGFLQVLEAQFELLDAGAALRRRPEPLAAQPGDLQPQPLDLEPQRQPGSRSRRLGRMPRLALRQDHRVSGGEVGGQRVRRGRHPLR